MIQPAPILCGAIVGACIGSFLATLAIRWGRGARVTTGRSCCDGCSRPLTAFELVPLLGYMLAKRRCRSCGNPIDPRHPALELACATIGALALARSPDAAGIAGALFGWGLAVLAVLDLDFFWLPDRIVLPLLAGGLSVGCLGIDVPVAPRMIGAACGWLSLTLLRLGYRLLRKRDGLGAGDAKLLAAIGAWLGWQPLPLVVLIAALIGLIWAGAATLRGRRPHPTTRLPLGTLLAIAAWPIWWLGPAWPPLG